MKHIIFLVFLYGFTSSRPQHSRNGKLALFGNYNYETDNFRYSYQTDDTILQNHKRGLKSAEDDSHVSVTSGPYYINKPNNIVHAVHYIFVEDSSQSTTVKPIQTTVTPKLENKNINGYNSGQQREEKIDTDIVREVRYDSDETIYKPQVAVIKQDQNSSIINNIKQRLEDHASNTAKSEESITPSIQEVQPMNKQKEEEKNENFHFQKVRYDTHENEFIPQVTVVKQDQGSASISNITSSLENAAINTSDTQKSQPTYDRKEESKNEDYHSPQTMVPNSMQNGTASEDVVLGSRIQTNVIITLTGPPG